MTKRLTNLWPAPLATQPLNATITVPGSRSLSGRYLILTALGSKPVTLIGLLRSHDANPMMGTLETLGVRCDVDSTVGTTVTVTPPVSGRFHGNVDVSCGLASTVMRFVPGLTLFADGPVSFDDDEQTCAHPVKPMLGGLEQLDATVDYHDEVDRLPFTITPPATLPSAQAQVSIDSSGSSRLISGLLLISSKLPSGLHLAHTGGKTPSLPHICMTVADVTDTGGAVEVDESARTWTVESRAMQLPSKVTVEPDLSNAASFLGAALIVGGTVRVPHWPETTIQPGGLLPGYLEQMGAKVSFPTIDGVRYCEVTGDGTVHGLDTFGLAAAGEIAPSLATIPVFTGKSTDMVGIGRLRGHKTSRLEALISEIRCIGGATEELPDGLHIGSVPAEALHDAVMGTYADRRMATFAAMLGLRTPDIKVINVVTTRKALPGFIGMWSGTLGQ